MDFLRRGLVITAGLEIQPSGSTYFLLLPFYFGAVFQTPGQSAIPFPVEKEETKMLTV